MLQYSPRLVTDSLVMCLDASNNKSLPSIDLPVKNGLVMWMDAADDTTFSYSSGTTVSQWRDKSGLNYHMVPVSAGPTRNAVLNSRKILAFTTSQQLWNSSINLITSAYTVFCVTRLTGTTNARVLSTSYTGATGTNWLLGHWSGQVNQYFAEGWVQYQGYAADTTWRIYMGDWSGSSTDLANLYSNGTSITSNSNGANAGPLGLGVNISSEVSTCEAAEIIVFNRTLSSVERKLIHTYLGVKWGVSNTDRSIIDVSGNSNDGLLGNGTVANMPLIDYYNKNAFKFDGTNDYIKVGTNSSLQSNTITIGAFFKTINNSQSTQFIAGYGDTGIAGYWLGMSGGPMIFSIGGGSGNYRQLSSTVTPNNDQIYYVTGTYDGTNQKVYINGSLQASATTVSGNISYSGLTDGFLLGQVQGFTSTRYLTGSIYNLHVYNRALTATEVSQNYEALKARFNVNIIQQGLVLNLDAGNPYSYAGAGTTWYDTTTNANNATASGTSYYSSSNGGLLNFPGNSSYYYTSAVSTFNLGAASFSMEAWVYLDAGTSSDNTYRGIISLGADSNNYVYIAKWRSGLYSGLYVQYVAGATTITGVYQANDYNSVSRWTHVIATKSGSTLSFYVNGALYGSMTNLTTTFTGNSSIYIAQAHSGVSSLNGYIGESRIYNISLSAAQVLQNYNATKDRFGL